MTLQEHVGFPGTDLCVSPIGLGPAVFAPDRPELQVHRLLDAFIDTGGNLIATGRACAGGAREEVGRAERVLGDWLCRRRKVRDRLVVALCTRRLDRIAGGSAEALRSVREDVDRSLRTLGTDRIELYCLNGDNRGIPVKELVDFTEAFRREGKVRYFGAANWSADRLEEAHRYANRIGAPGLVGHHAIFNLASWSAPPRDDDRVVMDRALHGAHRRAGLPLLASCPCADGSIGRAARDHATVEVDPLVELVRALSAGHRCSPDALLLAYLLHQPFPVFPLLGAARVEQFYEVIEGLLVRLTPAEVERLEATSAAGGRETRAGPG